MRRHEACSDRTARRARCRRISARCPRTAAWTTTAAPATARAFALSLTSCCRRRAAPRSLRRRAAAAQRRAHA
eukprot:scaffold15721_cov112-Isochrysis_galbana.AAC.6